MAGDNYFFRRVNLIVADQESVDMVRRYAHLAPDHLAEFAERLSRPRTTEGTNLAHDKVGKEVKKR